MIPAVKVGLYLKEEYNICHLLKAGQSSRYFTNRTPFNFHNPLRHVIDPIL